MNPIYVYVAGPLSAGDVTENVRKAVFAADYLLSIGYTPYCPHLTHFWGMITGDKSWKTWLAFDEHWLLKCDVLLRLPGESPGADREESFALSNGIPSVHNFKELVERFPLTSKTSEQNDCRCERRNYHLCYGVPEG